MKGIGHSPTSILRSKNGICIDKSPACWYNVIDEIKKLFHHRRLYGCAGSRNIVTLKYKLGLKGAGLFIAAYIVLFSGSSVTYSILLPILAFAGSICTAAVDYFLSLTRQGLSPRRLLLVGIAMSTAISSATTSLRVFLPITFSDLQIVLLESNYIAQVAWKRVLKKYLM